MDNGKEEDLKNLSRATILSIYISLGPFYDGFGLTIIPACNLDLLYKYYDIPLAQTPTLAILNGALPVGAVFGTLVFKRFKLLTTKRYPLRLCLEGGIII